jgi:hypothetical protein
MFQYTIVALATMSVLPLAMVIDGHSGDRPLYAAQDVRLLF